MGKQKSIDLLRGIPLFRGLSEDELNKADQLLIRRDMLDRMVVYMQGDPLEYIYFLVSGRVKIYRTDEQGREQIVHILQEGDMFPRVGFFNTEMYHNHCVMIEKGLLLALPRKRFRSLLESTPTLSLKLLSFMDTEINDLQGRLQEVVMNDAFGRIVYLLSRLSKSHGVPNGNRIRIDVPFTNQDLANMVGTSRETVNRTFSQLKKQSVLEITSDHYIILSPDQLRKQLPA